MGSDETKNLERTLCLAEKYSDLEGTEMFVLSSLRESELVLNSIRKDKNIKIRRFNEVQSLIYHTLYKNKSIFVDATESSQGNNKIHVVMLGLGQYGTEMLKALVWYCQVDGYELIIDAFDQRQDAESRLRAACPELLSPTINGRYNADDSNYTIRIHSDADVETFEVQEQIKNLEPVTYAFVALGSDMENVRMSIQLRSLLKRGGMQPSIQAVVKSAGIAQSKPVDAWHLRMLILGFDAFGQQALLQAMQLGVITRSNKLIFDVYDRDIAAKSEMFLNHFSFDTFERTENGIRLRESAADGMLEIRFHPDNVMYQSFAGSIAAENARMPYTYALIALEDANTAVSCARRLEQMLGGQNTPIVLRLDEHHDLSDSISSSFPHVHIVKARENMLSLDRIIGNQIDREAKQFNSFYADMHFLSGDAAGEPDKAKQQSEPRGEDEQWYRTSFYERCSSKAVAMHQSVKKDVWENFTADKRTESAEKEIRRLIGSNGSLMTCEGSCWRLNGSETQFLEALRGEPFAFEAAAAEHRRWCYFIASEGWCFGRKRDNSRKQHNCLMPFSALYSDDYGRTTIKYDLMPLMKQLVELDQR